jgi:type I restriction enzyme S subunit
MSSAAEFKWGEIVLLDDLVSSGEVQLGRGNVISKIDIRNNPGQYPIYSSSSKNDGKMGEYGSFMFDEELISWSVDGGGYFFHRPKHKFSVTNVSGYMRLSPSWDYRFTAYSLQFQHEYFSFDYQTKAHPSVIREFYLFPKVPHLEQKKIAAILSSVDRVIEKTRAQIDKLKDLKTGMMQELLTKGIGHTEFKDSPVGWIPASWNAELLDKVAARGSGHTPSKSQPEYWNGNVYWVSLSDTNKLDRLYISATTKQISELGIQNSSAVLHPPGTVVLSRDAGIGKSAIITKEMAVSQHFIAWRCSNHLDNHFLYYILQFWKPKFESIAMGSTIKTIGLPFFKQLHVPLPPISEQEAIAGALKSIDLKVFNVKRKLDATMAVKKALMQDLLTGKVRVNVDARELADA